MRNRLIFQILNYLHFPVQSLLLVPLLPNLQFIYASESLVHCHLSIHTAILLLITKGDMRTSFKLKGASEHIALTVESTIHADNLISANFAVQPIVDPSLCDLFSCNQT